MRVLIVTSNFPANDEDPTTPIVLNLAIALRAAGIEVVVLAPHGKNSKLSEEIRGVVVQRFRYFRPSRYQRLVGGGAALANLRQNPWLWMQVLPYGLSLWWHVRRLVSSGSFDVVHSHWIIPQGFLVELARREYRFPHVISIHGSDVFSLRNWLFDWLRRSAMRGSAAVTVNSSVTSERVREIAPRAKAPLLVRQGVALSAPDQIAVAAKRSAVSPGGGPIILFVGRLVEAKGVRDLIDAMIFIVAAVPDARLIIVGEGQDRWSFERRVDELGLNESVEFVGWVGNDDVAVFLAASDVLVGPSKHGIDGSVEAQGLVFAEAMTIGTPIIATMSGGIPEVVIDGETGILIPEGDAHAIAHAVTTVLSEPKLAERLSRSGIANSADFSVSVAAAEFMKLYKSITR